MIATTVTPPVCETPAPVIVTVDQRVSKKDGLTYDFVDKVFPPPVGSVLAMPAATAFLALNFTGSTTFTSRSGVKREMFAYIPAMAWTFGIGILLAVVLVFIR